MKKIIVFSLLLIISATSFSQQTTTPMLTKADYLKKSKTRKTVANIFLATGASCVLAAFVIPKGEKVRVSTGGTFWGVSLYDEYNKNDNIKGTIGGIGILVMLSSIPIYLASHHSKKKAMRLSFKNETTPQLQNGSFTNRPVPSLAVKIIL